MIEYIKEADLCSTYSNAKTAMEPLFRPFDEFERIARNRPHPGIAKELPKVTDGTVASVIKQRPKRIIQQLPTGLVDANDEWLKIVANYVLEHEIVNKDNFMAERIQKCWALISKAEIYGSQPAYVKFINKGDYYCTTFDLPYVKDVYLEPGKLGDKDSNVKFLNAWFQPNQIDAIIQQQSFLAKKAKERGEQFDSQWDVKALKEVKEKITSKDDMSRTPSEKEKGGNTQAIHLVHVFQTGIDATFYTFNPDTKLIVRRRKNPDPRGIIPIHYMYSDFDFSNPLGRGSVELAGPLQNLLDSEVQAYQYQRLYGMRPATNVFGNVTRSSISFKPGRVNHIQDPNARIEAMITDSTAIQNFPQNYGLIKSQILNLLGASATDIGAESGNPTFSKTHAGIKAREAELGVDDNHVRKQFESCLQEIEETELNLYFAEMQGARELHLDQTTANKLRKIQPEAVSPDNKIRIDYSTPTEPLKFTVNASSSAKEDTAAQAESINNLLAQVGGSELLTSVVGGHQDKIIEAYNALVAASGVENPEKLQIETEDEQGNPIQGAQPQEQQMTPEMVMQMIQEAMAQQPQVDPRLENIKALGIKYADLPESAKQAVLASLEMTSNGDLSPKQQELDIKKFDVAQKAAGPSDVELDMQEASSIANAQQAETSEEESDDTALIEDLTARGYSPQQIERVIELAKNEASDQELVMALGGQA